MSSAASNSNMATSTQAATASTDHKTSSGAVTGSSNQAASGQTNSAPQNSTVVRTGNYSIFNGGKIRIDLTNTRYKLIRECALEMKWKVITAKKRDQDGDATVPEKKASKKDGGGERGNKHNKDNEVTVAEQQKKDETARHANVDIIWNDVTI